MSQLASLFASLERTPLAKAIGSSTTLLASLSAVHLIGFTLIMGGAVVSNLRLAGMLFPMRTLGEIRRPAERGMLIGLLVSVTTGFLLFSARATDASRNSLFQIKMLALVAAVVCQFVLQPRVVPAEGDPGVGARSMGVIGLILWFALAVAACAFLLLEQ